MGREKVRSMRGVVIAAAVGLALAVPSSASAAASISLRITPSVPGEAKPFQVAATGTAERPGGDRSYVIVYVGQGDSACAPGPGIESTSSNGVRVMFESVSNGSFSKTAFVLGNGYYSYYEGDGLEEGKYRACGYVTDQSGEFTVRATDRQEFTVGGTCAAARSKLARANRRLRRARRALRRARRAGSARRIRRAKRAVRKARKRVRSARATRSKFC
jgi:hypothetical protein